MCGVPLFVFHEVSCKIPFIHGCIVQGYGIEPRVFTDAEPDDPTFMIPVSNDPSVAIVVAVAVAVAVVWRFYVFIVPGDFRIGRYGTRIWHIICFTCCAGSPCEM